MSTKTLKFLGHTLRKTKRAGNPDITMRAHVDNRLGPTKGDCIQVRVYHRKYGGSVAHCVIGVGGYLLEQVISGEPGPQAALDELERKMFARFRTLATLFDYELEE